MCRAPLCASDAFGEAFVYEQERMLRLHLRHFLSCNEGGEENIESTARSINHENSSIPVITFILHQTLTLDISRKRQSADWNEIR